MVGDPTGLYGDRNLVSDSKQFDPVATRLQEAGDEQRTNLLRWLDIQQQRKQMLRRATICAVGSWLLLVLASAASTLVSIYLNSHVTDLLEEEVFDVEPIIQSAQVSYFLLVVTILLVAGAIIAWALQCVPGYSRTASAIDWSASCDAVTQLTRLGRPFPEAFRAAAEIAKRRTTRSWFLNAAQRVESGGPELKMTFTSRDDTAVVEMLVSAHDGDPKQRWSIASEHLFNTGQRRLAVLLQCVPMISTILSGFILWLAITSTLGWMYQAMASMISDYGGGGF